MAKIPINLQTDELTKYLSEQGFELLHQGKVRNTWRINAEQLLVIATDRISIFDFVLNALIPKKGEVLTALTHFWLTTVLKNFEHHLLESEIDQTLNRAYDLKKKLPGLPLERSLIVKNMTDKIWPFEMIYRHHIGGSVFKKYQKTGMAGGHQLPPNLPKWSKLDKPIFTPSTKEDIGHDINVDADYFYTEMQKMAHKNNTLLEVVKNLADAYTIAYNYAEERGILILDTKFETADLTIIDEILTPDSSRFGLKKDWGKAMTEGRDPYFYDKQNVRNWGSEIETPFGKIGINNLQPENPEHVKFVHSLKIPDEIIKQTTSNYLKIFEMLTGFSLIEYQKEKMKV